MTVNSKQKGARSERELAKLLREHGYENARRSAQYCGNTGDAADIVDALPGFHIECKHQETTKIWDWLAQAERDHKEGTIPIVVFRRNRSKWQVCLDFERFLDLIKEISE